jgi:hypothetical protein
MNSAQQLSHRSLENTGKGPLPPWWDFNPIKALTWDRLAVRGDRKRLLVWAWLDQRPETTSAIDSGVTEEDVVAALQKMKAVKVVYEGV